MKVKIIQLIIVMLFGSLLYSLSATNGVRAESEDPQSLYFETLVGLCGARFEGTMTYPEDEQHDFAGKVLVASFATCSESVVSVPFIVGENRSRTWVFRKTLAGIQLKHDHRHADGSPDEITNYGGVTRTPGTSQKQAFPADDFTQKLIPDAATNVWTISLDADQSELSYHLERHGKPRFTAVLKRTAEPTAK